MQQLVAQIDEFNIIKALKRRFCLIWIDKAPFFCLKRKIFDLSKDTEKRRIDSNSCVIVALSKDEKHTKSAIYANRYIRR